MSRLARVIASSGSATEIVGPADAWRAAEIVTDAFAQPNQSGFARRVRLVGNYARLRVLASSVIDRERTAVVGVGGVRPLPLLACALVAGWVAPRLPRVARIAIVVGVGAFALQRNRLRRIVWVQGALRRHAPDALLAGEFAASEAGAGMAFATELVESLGPYTDIAATVQGPRGDRRARAQVRLYERRLGFTVVERRVLGGDELVLLARARAPMCAETALASTG